MHKTDIDFVWYRARDYELAKRNTVIRRKGPSEPYSPLRMEDLPFRFAKLDGSPQAALGFCKLFGFLKTWPDGKGDEETIALWRGATGLVRGWVEVFTGGVTIRDPQGHVRTANFTGGGTITNVNVWVSADPSGSRRLIFKPPDLLSAMLLMVAQSSAISTCKECGGWFQGKRQGAEFCSDRCRFKFNYKQKRRAGK